jgi:uncharacterized membrane protein YhiD involved in acid resistance
MASYVVSGVDFLGAGVIFKDSTNIRGLNTAATIWCSAAIGVLAGLGAPQFSILLAVAVIFTNPFCVHLRTGYIRFCPKQLQLKHSMRSTWFAEIPTKYTCEHWCFQPSHNFR